MFLLLLRENNVSFNFSLAIILYSLVTARINRLTKQLFFYIIYILYKIYNLLEGSYFSKPMNEKYKSNWLFIV